MCKTLLNVKTVADSIFLISLVLSVSISALAMTKLFQSSFLGANYNAPAQQLGTESSSSAPSLNQGEGTPKGSTSQDSQSGGSAADEGIPSYGPGAGPATNDGRLLAVPSTIPQQSQNDIPSTLYSPIYESSPYILPISWGAVAGTLIWRGKVRSTWCKQGYDYDIFRLVARMRGSPIRVKLLNSMSTSKNRLQLASELDVDWKTIDNHITILTKNGLVQQITSVGTSRYYVVTEHGKRVLSLLSSDDSCSGISIQKSHDLAETTSAV